ncbi:MAG: histidine kinase [Bacteroidales bacterium]
MKHPFKPPFHWRNLNMGLKLGIGFGLLIAVFFVLGMIALVKMRAIQERTQELGEKYIPVTNTTYYMEHFTHEAMHAMLGYSLSEEDHYYQAAGEHIKRINEYYARLNSMISSSPALKRFQLSGKRIGNELGEFKNNTEEMYRVTSRIKELRSSMKDAYDDFSRLTRYLLLRENVKFRNQILRVDIPADTLVRFHQRSKMINVIINKGNISRIETLQAIAQKNPELIKNVYQEQYLFLFSLIEGMREIADPGGVEMLFRIEESLNHYKTSMLEMAEIIEQSKQLESRMETTAFAALFEAHHISSEINKITADTSAETISLLDSSHNFLIFGLLMSLLLAILLSVKTTRNVTVPVKKSVNFAQQVAAGNLNAKVEVNQKDEVGVLANALKEMVDKLRDNIDALKQSERSRRNSILETEQKERKRFAEDLHDSLGPLLSTIKLYLNSFESTRYDQEQRSIMIRQANEVINEAITNAKSIANNLRPNLLEDFGLKVALTSFFEHVRNTNAIDVKFNYKDGESRLNPNKESVLYNTILELTNNALRHSDANSVSVNIKHNGDICQVRYTDDGKGCDLQHTESCYPHGFGIQNIVNRIQSYNGQIDLWSAPNKGFQAQIQV